MSTWRLSHFAFFRILGEKSFLFFLLSLPYQSSLFSAKTLKLVQRVHLATVLALSYQNRRSLVSKVKPLFSNSIFLWQQINWELFTLCLFVNNAFTGAPRLPSWGRYHARGSEISLMSSEIRTLAVASQLSVSEFRNKTKRCKRQFWRPKSSNYLTNQNHTVSFSWVWSQKARSTLHPRDVKS